MEEEIPIIDIFAGPGGLAEGFSSLINADENRVFKIALSIEKDENAHRTLKLRSFYRQFPVNQAPADYYSFVRGEITIDQLYTNHPIQAQLADEEAWCGTLGTPDETETNGVSNEEVDERIRIALNGNPNWVLIGGPPCQAYSLVGRARRQEIILDGATDKRVGLYKEYLRIIAMHTPAVFVMENVKGLLSARTESESIFQRILTDLKNPVNACIAEGIVTDVNQPHINYRIYSLTTEATNFDDDGNPIFNPIDYLIKSEDYGVPQRRHRVILLGVRQDFGAPQSILQPQEQITLSSVIDNLPAVRSGITRSFSHFTMVEGKNQTLKKKRHYNRINDSAENWRNYINGFNEELNTFLQPLQNNLNYPVILGLNYQPHNNYNLPEEHLLSGWFADDNLGGILQHVSRKHLLEDLKRYLFAARYSEINGTFPRLDDYRDAGNDLLPDHENAGSGKFTDRFRVQLPNISATTVTSHISKDGHYFIHYDPVQCRSLTVREAARIQTFPDNYYFCGERTNQFHQVGNAVPPYLAFQIAEIVSGILNPPLNENENIVQELERIN
ncbi:DNA cytosine methyltransferase [Flavobacterium seoulense]|uniref:DNA (cytosine-5-)-methyltransferase n=1 Tax=Flavobacterium seoulense TaxID=1492738 RepID=A0A066WTF1_9FLAO|nr:DNA (cytosine-5-)-methyltransferase [Flavobacterium seoulense]KDN53950.1 DNA methyltransferase [Flavobacterium seoulense]